MSTKRFKPPKPVKLVDAAAEQARSNHEQRISELQNVPVVGGKLIKDISLANGIDTPIPHGLGRRATVLLSPVRGPTTGEILIAAPAMLEVSTGSYFVPNGSQDYYEKFGAGPDRLEIPITGLVTGHVIKQIDLIVYRAGATQPAIEFGGADFDGSMSTVTPLTGYTNSTLAAWSTMTATYDIEVFAGNWKVWVDLTTDNDAVRACIVHVTPPLGNVYEVRSALHDPNKYFVLNASGYSSDVTVDAWVF